MSILLESGALLLGLFAAMLVLLEVGRRIGRRRLMADATGAHSGVGALEGAVFGLMGLLLAFTFSGAATRFDGRRELILKETNAIGTAWLRLDLLQEPARQKLRMDFVHYVDLRLAATRTPTTAAAETIARTQQRIWSQAVAVAGDSGDSKVAQLVLPALNEMFDVATERKVARETHPPPVVFVLLLVLALICSAMAGYGMAGSRTRSWLHILCFAGSLLLAIYVILDLEFPRRGLIRVDRYDQMLVDLSATMR